MQCAIIMLDFGTVRYCKVVADKQQNVYINACNGVSLGRIFSWVVALLRVSFYVISFTCRGGSLA